MSSTSPNVDGLQVISAATPAALVYKFVVMDASGAIAGRSAERFHVCWTAPNGSREDAWLSPSPHKAAPRKRLSSRCVRPTSATYAGETARVFGLVYQIGQEVEDLLKEAFNPFFAENGLNPTAFPSLRKFETEVVAMTACLLGGDEDVVGTVTAGGTEGLLAAVKTARDWARARLPEMMLPLTAHPAFDKAGEHFGVHPVPTPSTAAFAPTFSPSRPAKIRRVPFFLLPNTSGMVQPRPISPDQFGAGMSFEGPDPNAPPHPSTIAPSADRSNAGVPGR